MNKVYDSIIIGGGVIGGSIARFLSRFNGNFLVIEKHNDVANETSSANSGIVHSGYDPKPNTLKAKFNVLGNKMMKKLTDELDVPFSQVGSLTVGFNEDDLLTLKKLHIRGKENGVDSILIEDYEEIHNLEPNLSKNIKYALFVKSTGIVSPFNLTVGLFENAINNGVELLLNNEVIKIEKKVNYYEVFTNKGLNFQAKTIINATGYNSDKITKLIEEPNFKIIPRKGVYILFDHFDNNFLNKVIFMCPTKLGKGVLASPTTNKNYFIGPNNIETELDDKSTDKNSFDFLKVEASKIIDNLPFKEVIREFAGIRANNDKDDFIIYHSKINKGFFNVAGIMSPGLASSPAIGEYISKEVAKYLNLNINEKFNPYNKKHHHFTDSDYNEIIKKDKRYGHMVCRCEKISEGEIIDAIHRSCGATTIKGVKIRCKAGFGKCQGTFCQEEILKILARELNKDISEILYDNEGSEILKDTLKGK